MKKRPLFLVLSFALILGSYLYYNDSGDTKTKHKRIDIIHPQQESRLPSSEKKPVTGQIASSAASTSSNTREVLSAKAEKLRTLPAFSDTGSTFFVSKKYGAVHKKNFVPGSPYRKKMGNYYIVDKQKDHDFDVAYNNHPRSIGILTGFTVVTVLEEKDFDQVKAHFENDTMVEIVESFDHIRALYLKVKKDSTLPKAIKALIDSKNFSDVEIEFFQGGARPM